MRRLARADRHLIKVALRRSSLMLPIPGTSSIEHFEQNIAAASVRLTDDDYKKLFTVPALAASR